MASTFLRVLSILIILWTHHTTYTSFALTSFPPKVLVSLFEPVPFALASFVFLSGFKLINSEYSGPVAFIKKRILRIYPLYYISLFLFAFLLYKPVALPKLFIHMVGMQLILPNLFGNNLGTLWFVGMITLYYLLFIPLRTLLLKRRSRFFIISGLIYLLLLIFQLSPETKNLIVEFRVLQYLPYFIAGMYFGHLQEKMKKICRLKSVTIVSLAMFITGNLVFITLKNAYFIPFFHIFLLPLNVLTMMMLVQSNLNPKIRQITAVLSYASFAIYLFHRPIWYSLDLIYQETTIYHWIYINIIGIGLIISVSYLIQKHYDNLIRILEKK